MHPHDGVLTLDRLTPDKLAVSSGALRLRMAGVLGPKALQEVPDGFREPVVRSGLGSPCRVAADRGHGEECEDGDPRGLVFVGDVRVVPRGGKPVLAARVAVFVVWA